VSFRMLKPWVNPRSEFYWFRRRVPKAYLAFGMPAEIKFSLGTKDWDEAVLRCQEENLKLERQWRARLGTPPSDLSHLQIVALAGEFYKETVAAHREEPGRVNDWEEKLKRVANVKSRNILRQTDWLRMVFGDEARAFLQRKEIHLVGERFEVFIRAYVEAKERAALGLLSAAKRDYMAVDKEAPYYPKFEPPNPAQKFEVLWAEFDAAKGLAASTKKKWLPYFKQLIKRIGTDDMSRVTEQHLLEWRDALLATKVSRLNVKYGYIAAARAFFHWAKIEKKLLTDPGSEVFVTIAEKKKGKAKKRGFSDREATVILAAALAPQNETMTEENAAARKWVPWLCAYTGARVNEVTQLRACDVVDEIGIPCIHITADAGTVKTAEERTVPLHPHLIEMGFVNWAQQKKGKTPLFYATERQKKDRKNPTYTSVGNKLADWVRHRLKIDDPKVAPNHGWRHRFKAIGLKVDMKERVLDAIQGHAPRTEGEKYGGKVPADVMYREILKYPRYEIVAPTERRDRRRRGQRQADQVASA
jgi:integrase